MGFCHLEKFIQQTQKKIFDTATKTGLDPAKTAVKNSRYDS